MTDDQRTATGTVTSVSPLRVVADGAVTACPAEAVAGATLAGGDRVELRDRAPRRPLVTGKLEAL